VALAYKELVIVIGMTNGKVGNKSKTKGQKRAQKTRATNGSI